MKHLISGKELSAKLSKALQEKILALAPTVVLAVVMRNASTDDSKVVVEFAEKINLSDQPRSALALFNPGDDRFSQGARRVWMTMDRQKATEMFGISIPEGEAFAEIGKTLQPIVNEGVTIDFRIRITEKPESQMTDQEREYPLNYLKVIPSTGAHFIAKGTGERVASSTDLVLVPRKANDQGTIVKGDPKHVLIEGEYKVEGAASILQNAGTSVKLDKDFVS